MVEITRLGQVQGGSDLRAIFLPMFAPEFLGYAQEMDVTSGMFREKDTNGATSVRFRVYGRPKGFGYVQGQNILVQAEAGSKLKLVPLNYRDVISDNDYLMVGTSIPQLDTLLQPGSDEERNEIARDYATELTTMKGLRCMSMLMQNCATTDTIDPAGTPGSVHKSKASAAAKAGLTDGASNKYGYDIDAMSNGAAVYSALMRQAKYYRHGRVRGDFYAFIGTNQYLSLIEDAGDKVSTFGTAAGSQSNQVVSLFSRGLGVEGNGSIVDLNVRKAAGFILIECPWLTGVPGNGLGTELELHFTATPGSGAFCNADDEKKYQPTDGAGTPVGGNVQIKQNAGGGGEANTWAEHRDLLDKVGIITCHSSAIGYAKHIDPTVEGPDSGYEWSVQGYPWIGKMYGGWGPISPERSGYIATAKATTA